MGKKKQETQKTQTQQIYQVKPTPEERELQRIQLEQIKEMDPYQRYLQRAGLTTLGRILAGEPLSGYLSKLPGGISPEITQEIASQAIEDIRPYFQKSGILDSGVAARISARTAGDIRRRAEEFNIRNLMNLLNLAVGGQYATQQPLLATQQMLGARLAGLRPMTQSTTKAYTYMRPAWWEQFAGPALTATGTALGGSVGGAIGGMIGNTFFNTPSPGQVIIS